MLSNALQKVLNCFREQLTNKQTKNLTEKKVGFLVRDLNILDNLNKKPKASTDYKLTRFYLL